MRLLPNWKAVARYAWSIRLNLISTLLSGLEVWFTFIDPDSLPIPNGTFAAAAVVTTILANITRLMAQTTLAPERKKYEDEPWDA